MNYKERNFLVKTIRKLPKNATVVEVGSWTGGSALTMLVASQKAQKNINLFCVDPWRYGPGECPPELVEKAAGRDIKKEFEATLFPFKSKYKAIQDCSKNAAKRFIPESVDMLFLDGDHTESGVLIDLNAWLPSVKKGGIICGHDYNRSEYGVTKAVNEFFEKVENPARSMWITRKG